MVKEKSNENLEGRLQALESSYINLTQKYIEVSKKMDYLTIPALNDLMIGTIFSNKQGMGKAGLLLWVARRLAENIPEQMREYLAGLVEKIVLPPPLRKY